MIFIIAQRKFPRRVKDLINNESPVYKVPAKKIRERVMTPEYESKPIDFSNRNNSPKLFKRFTKEQMLEYLEPEAPVRVRLDKENSKFTDVSFE